MGDFFIKFRTRRCGDFLQQNCPNHKPYTCFNWHFENHHRRLPVLQEDGTFNYGTEFYCPKYDEVKGECSYGESCPFLHRVFDDSERTFHPRFYRTSLCGSNLDDNGVCKRNGVNCSYAHSKAQLRAPVVDVREFVLRNYITSITEECSTISLDDWSLLMTEDNFYDPDYISQTYKTKPCRKPTRLCKQGLACPYYHNSKDRRRSLSNFKYDSTACSAVKVGMEWLDPGLCKNGVLCRSCHTRTEQQFHPRVYKSSKCLDFMNRGYCPRNRYCAFAHSLDEQNKSSPEVTSPPTKTSPSKLSESEPMNEGSSSVDLIRERYMIAFGESNSLSFENIVKIRSSQPRTLNLLPRHTDERRKSISFEGATAHSDSPKPISLTMRSNDSSSPKLPFRDSYIRLLASYDKSSVIPSYESSRIDLFFKIDVLENALQAWEKDCKVAKERIDAANQEIKTIALRMFENNDHESGIKYILQSNNIDGLATCELLCLLDNLKKQSLILKLKLRYS